MGLKPTPRWMLNKMLNKTVTLNKVTESEISGDIYGMTTESKATYSLNCKIQDVTFEDLQFLPAGMMKIGDAVGYFLDYYVSSGHTYTVEAGDLILDRGSIYRVENFLEPTFGDYKVFKRAYLKRLSGGGT